MSPEDLELMKLAAKAIGPEVRHLPANDWVRERFGCYTPGGVYEGSWEPLDDDGDEARLEAKLGLNVFWYEACVLVSPPVCGPDTGKGVFEYFAKHGGGKQAARRVAGVKAAAEIGKLPPQPQLPLTGRELAGGKVDPVA